MNTTQLIALIALFILNGACLIGLDQAPARGITLGPDKDGGGYPVIDTPSGWRRLWRPACLYGAVATAIAAAVVPVLIG
ncbi:hypothetical protein [Mycolicibacterium cosmeticum]|uniref:hypothetical protein n=1 Tax=Mycolicibacterium cosmeticum TaxID=258533 RepID=UPI0032047805